MPSDARPDPDAILAEVTSQEARAHRGQLKIFFGYAAGVGKTYAMLEAAHRELVAGTDVVIGYVELHGRPETEALLTGLEVLPAQELEYRGVKLREFDLDAALRRNPAVILVDELAHTNAEGCRHAKRWQDVEELLEAGINVYTTLNVQHIESLNDIIEQITGVAVRETLPDGILEIADEIVLIDLTPDELVERLREGKVYVPTQAQRALERFFQRGNLVALRELSLRRVADRLNVELQKARRDQAAKVTWPTTERLLVCVGPSPTSAKLIRSAKRLATLLHCEWLAVSVEAPSSRPLGASGLASLSENIRLAERLGAETVTLSGSRFAEEILSYARGRNVSKIVVGKTNEPWWKVWWYGSVVDDLLRLSGEIDIYVIRGVEERKPSIPRAPVPSAVPWHQSDSLGVTVILAASTAVAAALHWSAVGEANVVMIFLLGVLIAASRYGRRAGIIASLASVLCFDFFFVPPEFTFSVRDGQYIITFAVMLFVALVTSGLTAEIRDRVESSRLRERRTASLFQLSRQLAGATGSEFLIAMAGRQIAEIVGGDVIIFLPNIDGKLEIHLGHDTQIARNPINQVVAQWVFDHQQRAGAGTDTLPNATALFLPLTGSRGTAGVVGVKVPEMQRLHQPDQRQMLETCASLVALAIERDRIAMESQQVLVRAETERLRNSLLSAVSHDLRTPLAVISGAASAVMELPDGGDVNTRLELIQTIVEQSRRLSRLVDNLLEMSRIEAGCVEVRKQWNVMEELVGTAIQNLQPILADRPIQMELPADFPLVSVDGTLIESVLINLLENAAKYSPPGTAIEVIGRHSGPQVVIEVADHGPGLSPGEEKRVFDKFYRGNPAVIDGQRGAGLGLAICKTIVEAHGGTIHVANRPEGGARFWFALPIGGTPPTVDLNAPA